MAASLRSTNSWNRLRIRLVNPANSDMRYIGHGVGNALCARILVGFALLSSASKSALAETRQGSREAIAPISAAFCEEMRTHHVLNTDAKVGCDRLRLVKFSYFGFDDKMHDDGETVVMDAAATHVLRIFGNLRKMRFPIFKARPMNEFDGDDKASMRANNTSAFNDRILTGGSAASLHAYGLAIDVNPVQNPFLMISGGSVKIEPPAGADYINRMSERPGKPSRRGMAEAVVRLFAEDGFLMWGGYWDSPIDYQHFQVSRELAERLAGLPSSQAAGYFDRVINRFRACERSHPRGALPNPKCLHQADDPATEP
jgi:D-alanyl-D-alanine carboxypeptidase